MAASAEKSTAGGCCGGDKSTGCADKQNFGKTAFLAAEKDGGLSGKSEQIQELIAIGAAITAHCQPCLSYHVGCARELGVSEEDIKAAVAIGESLQRGAAAAMHKFVRESLGRAIPDNSCCRPPEPSKSCCKK